MNKRYFVSKIVLTFSAKKKCSGDRIFFLEIKGWRPRICVFLISLDIFFFQKWKVRATFETKYPFNLLLKVSKDWPEWIWVIKVPIGSNNWGVEKYRNKIKRDWFQKKDAQCSVIFYSKIIPKIYIPQVHQKWKNNLFQASNRSSDIFIRDKKR